MPLTSTVEFDTVMNGLDYTVKGTLTINLPASDYVDFTRALSNVSLQAQMNTDLPDQVRTVAGLEALTGDITIAGSVDPHGNELKTAGWLFNPDSIDSPLRHLTVNDCEIFFDFGVYVPGSKTPEQLRKLTGWINGYDPYSEDGSVVFHVVDLDPKWDVAPVMPAVVTAPPYNATMTGEFVMDSTIRFVHGCSSWPAARANTVLSVGFQGSPWAEVGTLLPWPGNPNIAWGQGDVGRMLLGSAAFANVPYLLSSPLTTSLRVEYRAKIDTTDPLTSVFFEAGNSSVDSFSPDFDDILFQLQPGANGLYCRSYFNHVSFGPDLRDGLEHHIVFLATLPAVGGSSVTVSAEVDGVAYSGGTFSRGGARGATAWDTSAVFIGEGASLSSLIVSTETAIAPSNFGFVPIARLDESLSPLAVIPALTGDTKAWDVMQQVAAAECGYVRRQGGVIVFTNRQTILTQQPIRTITSDVSLKSISTTVPPASAYRRVNVPYTEWDYGKKTVVYTLPSKKRIPRGTTTWTQPLTDTDGSQVLAGQFDTTAALLPDGHDPTDGNTWYRASLDVNGLNAHPGLSITITPQSAAAVQVSVTNKYATAYLTTPASYSDFTAGTTSTGLWIGGVPVTPGDEATVFADIDDGLNPLDVASNPYIQDHDTAYELAKFLLCQVFIDIRDFTNVSVVPDARIEPADLYGFQEQHQADIDDYAIVWGWSLNLDFPQAGQPGGSAEMLLNVRALGPVDAWLGDITGRSEADLSWAY